MKALIPTAAALLVHAGAALAADPLPPTAAAKPDAVPEPKVERIVTEDNQVRVEELRVRGQTQSITVKSKIPGVAPYQIVPATPARDPSQPGGTAGQRVWHFTF